MLSSFIVVERLSGPQSAGVESIDKSRSVPGAVMAMILDYISNSCRVMNVPRVYEHVVFGAKHIGCKVAMCRLIFVKKSAVTHRCFFV